AGRRDPARRPAAARGAAARDGAAWGRLPAAAPEHLSPFERRGEPAAGRLELPLGTEPRRGAGAPRLRTLPHPGGEAAPGRGHLERRTAAPARDRAQPD